MHAHDSTVASGLQAPRSGAGLVPYTTSDTRASGAASTPFELAAMVQAPAALSRLRRLRHHVRTASRLIRETMHREGAQWRAVFVTLTYAPGVEWSPRHVTDFIKNVRMWGARQGVRVGYVWVAEMQRRGAVHYHAVIWIPSRLQLPKPDRRGWWRHGMSNVQAVKRNGVGYLMKYVSKGLGDDPDLPLGARVCGSGGLDAMARAEFHYWRLPRYVREHVQIGERCRRAQGGGWVSTVTGQLWRSDYGLFGIARISRGADCNGRPRRDDTVCLLSDSWGREQGRAYDWSEVQAALREVRYYQDRQFMAGVHAAYADRDLAAIWAVWNQA